MYIDQDRRHELKERQILEERLQNLTSKEREVLRLLAQGKSVKEISEEVEVGVRSIEMRRANLMKKLEVESVAELLHFIERVYHGRRPLNGNGHGRSPSFFQRPHEHYWCTNGASRSLPARNVSS
jgi:DNA-binding CsgD family transcriptional regulator